MPGRAPRAWRKPCGWVLIIIAVLAMMASLFRELSTQRYLSLLPVLVEFVTNPLVVVGMPLGIYWVRWSSRPSGTPGTGAPPIHQPTPAAHDSLKTDSRALNSSSSLFPLCLLLFIGGFGVIFAILNSGGPQAEAPRPVEQIANETPNQQTPRPQEIASGTIGESKKPSPLLPPISIKYDKFNDSTVYDQILGGFPQYHGLNGITLLYWHPGEAFSPASDLSIISLRVVRYGRGLYDHDRDAIVMEGRIRFNITKQDYLQFPQQIANQIGEPISEIIVLELSLAEVKDRAASGRPWEIKIGYREPIVLPAEASAKIREFVEVIEGKRGRVQ
jgi:hypothetical protein